MTFESEFLDLMPETITIEQPTSQDGYGKRSYGAAISYRCRVVEKLEKITTVQGREDFATTKVYVAPNASSGLLPTLSARIRVTLPDGTQPNVVGFGRQSDEDGPHHALIYFGFRGDPVA